MKDYQIKSWQKRFPERTAALKSVKPLDTALSFSDRLTLHAGGKTIELINVDDTYNPGDVAVWLPEDQIMHAGFVGYIGRHPDIRPDYSHGTTWGMLKQRMWWGGKKKPTCRVCHGYNEADVEKCHRRM